MDQIEWRRQGEALAAEAATLRLKVYRTEDDRYARFTVSTHRGRLIGSGTVADLITAMGAARQMAKRYAGQAGLGAAARAGHKGWRHVKVG